MTDSQPPQKEANLDESDTQQPQGDGAGQHPAQGRNLGHDTEEEEPEADSSIQST